MNHYLRCATLVAALALASAAAAQEPGDYYLYQRAALPQALHLDVETAMGTRDAGVFGRRGVEGLARSGVSVGDRWTLEGSVGFGENRDDAAQAVAWSAEARYGFSVADGWALGLGAGDRRDLAGVNVPYLRLVGEHAMARWHLAMNGVVEAPQAADRDGADFLLDVGASYALDPRVRLGIENDLEDLEGFFGSREAEGGARLVLGPTLLWRAGAGTRVKAHVGWIHALTANAPTNPDSPDYRYNRNGVLARLSLGFGI